MAVALQFCLTGTFLYRKRPKREDHASNRSETADLIYHLMVMLVQQGIPLDDVLAELDRRSEKTGNLKKFHVVDKNS